MQAITCPKLGHDRVFRAKAGFVAHADWCEVAKATLVGATKPRKGAKVAAPTAKSQPSHAASCEETHAGVGHVTWEIRQRKLVGASPAAKPTSKRAKKPARVTKLAEVAPTETNSQSFAHRTKPRRAKPTSGRINPADMPATPVREPSVASRFDVVWAELVRIDARVDDVASTMADFVERFAELVRA